MVKEHIPTAKAMLNDQHKNRSERRSGSYRLSNVMSLEHRTSAAFRDVHGLCHAGQRTL